MGSEKGEAWDGAILLLPWGLHFQNGETTYRHLYRRLLYNSTIFAVEATAFTLTQNYHEHMGPVHRNSVVYDGSMPCLEAIECDDTENHFICQVINLLRSGLWVTKAHVFFHAGYLAIVALMEMEESDSYHKKPSTTMLTHWKMFNVQILNHWLTPISRSGYKPNWDVSAYDWGLYLLRLTLGPLRKF